MEPKKDSQSLNRFVSKNMIEKVVSLTPNLILNYVLLEKPC
jgi:hypothetical protein